jgi:hypothetical protein
MAAGEFFLFNDFSRQMGDPVDRSNFPADQIMVALITSAITPTVADVTPTWSDYSTYEVSGSNYTAGGKQITGRTWTESGGVATLDGDDLVWVQNGSGFTNARWAIVYNTTQSADIAIGFIDLGSDVDSTVDDVEIIWGATGVLKHEVNV